MTQMPAHEVISETFKDLGLTTAFGLMGDANMLYISRMREMEEMTFIDVTIEGTGVLMAAGYQHLNGGVGVAMTTHGPGLTNTLTATVEASRARTPLLLVTGEVPSSGAKDHLQRYDLAGFARSAEAGYVRCTSAGHLARDIRTAAQQAWSQSRPVLLDLPRDLFFQPVDYSPPRPLDLTFPRIGPDLESDEWNNALGVIASARRPLILAGRGAVLSGAREVLIELGDRLGAVLGTSVRGKDLFHGEHFNLGLMGGMGTPVSNDIASRADVVIAFGAGLNDLTTSDYSLTEGRPVIHCDVDRHRIGSFSPVDVGLVGEATFIATQMIESLKMIDHKPSGFRTEALREEITGGVYWTDIPVPEPGFVDQRDAIVHFEETLPSDRILVTDVGRFQKVPWRLMHVDDARKFVPTASFASIGLGLQTGLGASLARPDLVTAIIVGDGGLMMNIVDFHTAVRYELPIVVVVINDEALGAEWRTLIEYGKDPAGSKLPRPDFAQLASAMGGHGVTVDSEEDYALADKLVAERCFPLLIDVRVDPSVLVNL